LHLCLGYASRVAGLPLLNGKCIYSSKPYLCAARPATTVQHVITDMICFRNTPKIPNKTNIHEPKYSAFRARSSGFRIFYWKIFSVGRDIR